MTTTISERIAASEAKLAGLRARRGSALLDGEAIDAAEVISLEQEIEALRDAEGEQVRRERSAAAMAREAHRSEQRARLKELERQRVDALQTAETAARTLARTLERLLEVNAEMGAAAHEISGTVPMPLSGPAFARRLSDRLAAVMSTVKGHRSRIGNLAWPQSWAKADDSWADEESRSLAPHLTPIYGETK